MTSIWQYLHEKLGTWKKGKATALKYYRGQITYDEWARLDAMTWYGIELRRVSDIIESVPYVDGARDTFNLLRKRGMKIAVVSAGISLLVNRIAKELGADFAVANELLVKDRRLTGEIKVKVSLDNKCNIIREIVENFRVDMKACAVVGDYSYDIPEDAGFKIAFNPKDKQAEKLANVVVRSRNIADIVNHMPGFHL